MTDEREQGVADRLAVFGLLWALVHLWHLLGNPDLAPNLWQGLLAVAVAGVVLCPGSMVALGLMAAAQLVTVWWEAPVLGNHWLLIGFVNAALLVALAVTSGHGRGASRLVVAARWFSVARWCLLVFYVFAAFAKLNAGFFTRATSCATFFFDESTESLGLEALQLDGAVWLDWFVIYATAAVELAIPPLLVLRGSRRWGVVLALVFHGLLALDRTHQFFDFSSAITALVVLFLPAAVSHRAAGWFRRSVERVRAQSPRAPELGRALVAVAVGGSGLAVALDRIEVSAAFELGWWTWQIALVAILAAAVGWGRGPAPATSRRALRLGHPALAVVVALVVANGLTPYLEIKTAFGWNMYANLRTVDGDSNHFLLRATLPLTDEQDEVVRIIDSSDAALRAYRDAGYGLTRRQLRTYLSDHPEIAIEVAIGEEVIALDRAADRPELVEAPPSWQERLAVFRAVDLEPPEGCQPQFGPAR